nr:hypothetical protein [Rappaport israeli]
MIEKRPLLTIFAHATLIFGVLVVMFPVWVMFVTATHDVVRSSQVPLPMLPGNQLWINLKTIFSDSFAGPPVLRAMFNSLVMALGITFGKIFYFAFICLCLGLFQVSL